MNTISRQRKWQMEKQAQGLCIICGKKAVTKQHCEEHRKDANKAGKKYRNSLTKRVKRSRI